MDNPEEKGQAMFGVSKAALLGTALIFCIIIILLFYTIFSSLGFGSGGFFWAGFLSFIIAVVTYFIHAATESQFAMAIVAVTGIFGIVSLYVSIHLSPGTLGDKIVPIVAFSIAVIFVLLMVFGMTKGAAEDERRKALRKKT